RMVTCQDFLVQRTVASCHDATHQGSSGDMRPMRHPSATQSWRASGVRGFHATGLTVALLGAGAT
ncbi:MAG: hypothetical protein ACYDA6_09620, partial [Solirubrobacteraceae bacterium]